MLREDLRECLAFGEELVHRNMPAPRSEKIHGHVVGHMYSDAGNRLRNASSWDKEDSDYKKQLEEKQKAVDAARQELEEMGEQARKAGVRQKE